MLEHLKRIKIAEIEEKIMAIKQEPPQKYNWFERNIFKKREYEAYQRQQKRIRREQLEELEAQKNKYLNAMCIAQLGYDLESAIETLNKHGITPVISEEEIQENIYKVTKKNIDDKEGIILVHKTHYVPTGAKIKTVKDSDVYEPVECQVSGHTIPMIIQNGRDTIHFAANGEVKEHMAGKDWDMCKYAILVPFVDIPKEQYANVFPNDTYTRGSVELTDRCWILVPKGEGQTVRQNNPNVNVIEYEGPTVTGYADKMVGMLGYRPMKIDPGALNGWRDMACTNKFTDFASKEGFRSGKHHLSYEYYQEKFTRAIQIIIQLIKYVEMNPETLNDPQFVQELSQNIKDQIIYADGTPENICKDIYVHLVTEGYELSTEVINELGKLEPQNYLVVRNRLTEEIIKMLYNYNQLTKNQSQGIKK